jgi:hypothetical protein
MRHDSKQFKGMILPLETVTQRPDVQMQLTVGYLVKALQRSK